jgi:hypothetical protein
MWREESSGKGQREGCRVNGGRAFIKKVDVIPNLHGSQTHLRV